MTTSSSMDLVFITNTRGTRDDFEAVYASFPGYNSSNFTPPDIYDWKGVKLVTTNGETINGRVIVIGSDSFDILDGTKGLRKAIEQTMQAIQYAKEHGAKVVCFGAGTKKLVRPSRLHQFNQAEGSDLIFSNGDTVTAGAVLRQLTDLAEHADISLDDPLTSVLVVGAYGVIGTQVSKFLSQHACRLVLVGPKMEMLQQLTSEFEDGRVELHTQIDDVHQKIDLVIAATNHPQSLILPSHFREWGDRVLAIDVAEPANISQNVVDAMRGRLIRIDGGIVRNLGLTYEVAPIVGLKTNEAFACLAEGLILPYALKKGMSFSDVQLMDVESDGIEPLMELSDEVGFKPIPPTTFGTALSQEVFANWHA